MLGLMFAYATNGYEIIEVDYTTGLEAFLAILPRAVEGALKGDRRMLLTMATGTGKTAVAFQICWKLWSARWNRSGEYRRPRILYLADRNILVDQPKDGIFAVFGDARHKIEGGQVVLNPSFDGDPARITEEEITPDGEVTSVTEIEPEPAAPGERAIRRIANKTLEHGDYHAGYEDVNDAERLRHDPAMRWVVGEKAAAGCAASASQMWIAQSNAVARSRLLSKVSRTRIYQSAQISLCGCTCADSRG